MAAIEGRNRDDIHECKRHGEKCGDVPECHPIPFFREDGADGTETADAFHSLFCGYLFHRFRVGCEFVGAHLYAARNGREQVIVLYFRFVEFSDVHFESDAHLVPL